MSPFEYALTLWRPWSDAIVFGPKRVENRTWQPPKRLLGQRIAIHAGKQWTEDGYAFCCAAGYVPPTKQASAQGIVGTARLVGVIADNWDGPKPLLVAGGWGSIDRAEAMRWYCGPYGWLLDEIEALPTPVPCTGRLGLWRVPAEVVAQAARSA